MTKAGYKPSLLIFLGVFLCLGFFIAVGAVWQLVQKKPLSPSSPTPSPTLAATPPPTSPAQGTYSGQRSQSFAGFTFAGHRECRARIDALGEQLESDLRKRRSVNFQNLAESQKVCPVSGAAYRVFPVGPSEFVLYCPGHSYEGRMSARMIRARRGFERASQDNWQGLLVNSLVLRSCDNPALGLSDALKSYSLENQGGSLVAAFMCALDLSERSRIEQLAAYSQFLPHDFNALLCRAHALGYLGRDRESENVCRELVKINRANAYLAARVRGLMAAARGDGNTATREFELSGAYCDWANAWIALASKDFSKSLAICQRALATQGYHGEEAVDWVRLAVISGAALGGDAETQGKAILARGLTECPKIWPYPILRYLNLEIDENQLRLATPDFSRAQQRTQATIAMLRVAHHGDARLLLRQLDTPWNLDAFVARRWLAE